MRNFREYGNPPYTVVVLHGGPGVPGEMAPVARELSTFFGIIEPLQTGSSIKEQVTELKEIVENYCQGPIILIGFSWGAMLAFIFAAQNSLSIKKLILISSAVFEEQYAANIMSTRLSRLRDKDKSNFESLLEQFKEENNKDKNKIFLELGLVISKADSFDPIPHENEIINCSYNVYEKVWNEAANLRRSGKLLALGEKIHCPVIAIHGDYDHHPIFGVEKPLSSVLRNFKVIKIEECGHYPWYEKRARDKFYDLLKKEIE